jgi:hypothetical protein
MTANAPTARLSSNGLWADLALVAFLVGLVVAARLLPHLPNFNPVVAAALFAGATLNRRLLALAVPLLGMAVSDLFIARDFLGVTVVVYAALLLPALIGICARRFRTSRMFVPAVLGSTLTFFAASNLAVWAFSGMYSLDTAGLIACFVAALPFLQYSIAGDLAWSAVLFGGAYLVLRLTQRGHGAGMLASS